MYMDVYFMCVSVWEHVGCVRDGCGWDVYVCGGCCYIAIGALL